LQNKTFYDGATIAGLVGIQYGIILAYCIYGKNKYLKSECQLNRTSATYEKYLPIYLTKKSFARIMLFLSAFGGVYLVLKKLIDGNNVELKYWT
jgi:hypothetical protein